MSTSFNSLSSHSPLHQAWHVLSCGMHNQNTRATIAAQNFVNADSTGDTPGAKPYTRKQVTFEAKRDPHTSVITPHLRKISDDPLPPRELYQPGHPAADEKGMVKYPHINRYFEASDYQQANLASHGCATLYQLTNTMLERTHNLMRSA